MKSRARGEFGQNFLSDRSVVAEIVRLVGRTSGPILEIGPGDGALTPPLEAPGRPLTAVEVDGRRARELRRLARPPTTVVESDFLRYRLPSAPYVLVGNLPFHRTTALPRRALHAGQWTDAVLLVQWEVARRRAGVGGATMMTAQADLFDLARSAPPGTGGSADGAVRRGRRGPDRRRRTGAPGERPGSGRRRAG